MAKITLYDLNRSLQNIIFKAALRSTFFLQLAQIYRLFLQLVGKGYLGPDRSPFFFPLPSTSKTFMVFTLQTHL